MAFSMFIGGFICDALGMKKIMLGIFLSHIIGSVGMIATPFIPGMSSGSEAYVWLYAMSILMGVGNGLTEVASNPLVASLYPHDKTHYLNILHAWWPGGLVIGGVSALLVGKGLNLTILKLPGMGLNWQVSLCLIALPAVIYGLMLIPAKFPRPSVSSPEFPPRRCFMEVLRHPPAMGLLHAAHRRHRTRTAEVAELRHGKHRESLRNDDPRLHLRHDVYSAAFCRPDRQGSLPHRDVDLLRRILRYWTVPVEDLGHERCHRIRLCDHLGLGIAYFWPTMLGVAAEHYPKGGISFWL